MTEITLLNSKLETSGTLDTEVSLTPKDINVPVVHQAVKAILANRRQGTACTKNRSAVRGGGAKPFKQKGTGRARQGTSRSPLMVGGGVTFGPMPRDYSQKVNKKAMILAIRSVIADKLQAGKLTVVDKIESDGKTKSMFNLLDGKGLLPALLVTSSKDSPAIQAVRNLQYGRGMAVEGFSVYEALKYENLLIEKEALETLLKRMV